MRNIWLVIKHDVGITLRQRSFWITTLLLPAMLLLLNAYAALQESGESAAGEDSQVASEGGNADQALALRRIGLVDEYDLLARVPSGFPQEPFTRFSDRDTAQAALKADEIEQFIFIPEDFATSGQVTVYARNFQIRRGADEVGVAFDSPQAWVLRYLIEYNLTGDEMLVNALRNPTPGELATTHALDTPAGPDPAVQALAQVVANAVPYIYYFLLLIGSGYLMRSVVAEKENRTVEVLLLSLPPVEIMVGKILAMSVVILLQVVVWVGGGLLILDRSAPVLNLAAFTFPPGFFLWATLFLLLGYLLFAAVMAAAGAVATNAREGGQMTWLLVIPLMPTLMFGDLFLEEPTHPITIGLSLFPFSAPSAMVTRLAIGDVPLWQIAVSLTALGGATFLMIRLAARYFRSGNLLSLAPFNWRRMVNAWRD